MHHVLLTQTKPLFCSKPFASKTGPVHYNIIMTTHMIQTRHAHAPSPCALPKLLDSTTCVAMFALSKVDEIHTKSDKSNVDNSIQHVKHEHS